MLLKPALAKFIKTGTLQVTDAAGDKYTFSGSSEPEVGIRFHNKRVNRCTYPRLYYGLGKKLST